MAIWRKILITFFILAAVTSTALLFFVDDIIHYNYTEITSDFNSYVNDSVSRQLDIRSWSEEYREKFLRDNDEELSEYINTNQYFSIAETLYCNKLFIKIFGRKAFNESIASIPQYDFDGKYSDKAYRHRVSKLKAFLTKKLYPSLKEKYDTYQKLSTKERKERESTTYFAYTTVLLGGILVYLFSFRKIGHNNTNARKLAYYNVVCEIISLLVASATLILDKGPINGGAYDAWALLLLPSFVINPIMLSYMSSKSKEDYHQYYLIPKWFTRTFRLSSDFKKRLLMVFLFYPLFYIVPLPYGGVVFFGYYIIPVSIICIILYGIFWIAKGRKNDKRLQIVVQEKTKAQIYCRYCGKLIEADSDYCRYCGNKL